MIALTIGACFFFQTLYLNSYLEHFNYTNVISTSVTVICKDNEQV